MIPRAISKFVTELAQVRKTTAFRFSLIATLFASVITCTLMMLIYHTARQEISAQVDTRLISEATRIRRQYESRSNFNLYTPHTGIPDRIQTEPSMSYCITKNVTESDDANSSVLRNNISLLDTRFSDLCMIGDEMYVPSRSTQTDILSFINRDSNDNLMRIVVMPLNYNETLIVGYDTHNERRILRQMLSMAFFATSLLIVASFLGSFFISRTITNSTRRISRTARRIVDGDFEERIPIKKTDSHEMQSLASDLNHMLERIDGLITSQRQVTNNIAHDMRSPLNRLRSRMEVALINRERSNTDLREVIGESIEDIDKLLQTFNAMLTIAQVEARARDDFTRTNISNICEELAELYDVFIEESGLLTFKKNIAKNLEIYGNRQLIAQAITNLLDNAVKYTPVGGSIVFEAIQKNNRVCIIITDNGPGIPEKDRKRVLQRFVRLDSARSTPGNGLGLSMVAAVINLHDGKIRLHGNEPGLKIELIFPNVDFFRLHEKLQNTPPRRFSLKKQNKS